ncbi:MAG: peptidylprolyl isomerase [Planctomycetota bacterium]|jgi:hypothetical protein
MQEKLEFSLPEKKTKGGGKGVVIFLLVILIVLVTANLFIKVGGNGSAETGAVSSLSAEQTKELASKLARRNLYQPAAKVWQDYLLAADITKGERARLLFQIGTLLEKANRYGEAIEYYYRSETAAKLDDLSPQINSHIKECFEKLGKFSALRYELMERTSLQEKTEAGGRIVAEIGPEKFTEAQLDALIEKDIDTQMESIAAFMTDEQLRTQKKKILEQYKNPQAKLQFLQNWVSNEILYRQALEDKLPDKTEVKELIHDMTRSLLSQNLMNKLLAEKINITESDLQTYYEANKDKYVEDANDRENKPKRQKSFDEVRQDAAFELVSQKRREVQQDYIREMMDKYNVIIHTSAFSSEAKEEK